METANDKSQFPELSVSSVSTLRQIINTCYTNILQGNITVLGAKFKLMKNAPGLIKSIWRASDIEHINFINTKYTLL